MQADDGADDGDLTTFRSFFDEGDEVLERASLVASNNDMGDVEWIARILDGYQEQPQLLDTHLPRLMAIVVDAIRLKREAPAAVESLRAVFRLAYVIVKVRGAKAVGKYWGHEVSDVLPTLSFLMSIDPLVPSLWEARYVLLLWLSTLLLIPFSLSTIDGSGAQQNQQANSLKEVFLPTDPSFASAAHDVSIVTRVLAVANFFLPYQGREREGAAMCIARLLSRRDVLGVDSGAFVEDFVGQVNDALGGQSAAAAGTPASTNGNVVGLLMALCALLKVMRRSDVSPALQEQLYMCHVAARRAASSSSSTMLTKMAVKLTQRLGVALLVPKVAKWRYKRGGRFVNGADSASSGAAEERGDEAVEVADVDHYEQIEEFIDTLLDALNHRDTVVRWSAAKGLGRICERLPFALSDDVIGAVLRLFQSSRSDPASWHGLCLSLAELSRRGILLPRRLAPFIPLVRRALYFESRVGVGGASLAIVVRDAACYVCWALARAYHPDVLATHVTTLAVSLSTVSVFDREVNVRRAASAAYQELVGRMRGAVPHGIDVIRVADYFAVGGRARSFVQVAPAVASIGGERYRESMVAHLVEQKAIHWDRQIRILAAKAMQQLVADDVELGISVIDSLYGSCFSTDPAHVHGSLMALGAVIAAVSAGGRPVPSLHQGRALARLPIEVISTLGKAVASSDVVGEALAAFIGNLADARVRLDSPDSEALEDQLITLLKKETDFTREAARDAVGRWLLAKASEAADDEQARQRLLGSIAGRYIELVDSNVKGRGALAELPLVLAVMPAAVLAQEGERVVSCLVDCLQVQHLAERVRAALTALIRLFVLLPGALFAPALPLVLQTFGNYTTDERGDVGSLCREEAMDFITRAPRSVLDALMQAAVQGGQEPGDSPTDGVSVEGLVLQQMLERIDRTRVAACVAMRRILFDQVDDDAQPGITWPAGAAPGGLDSELLRSVFSAESLAPSFLDLGDLFTRATALLAREGAGFSTSLLLGLSASAGGGAAEAIMTAARTALLMRLLTLDASQRWSIASRWAALLSKYAHHERLASALVGTLRLLVESASLGGGGDGGEVAMLAVVRAVRKAIATSGDMKKIAEGVYVLAWAIEWSEDAGGENIDSSAGTVTAASVKRSAFGQLAVTLCSKFPRARTITASALYTAALGRQVLRKGKTIDLLIDTDWTGALKDVKPRRDLLCDMYGEPRPTPIKPAAQA